TSRAIQSSPRLVLKEPTGGWATTGRGRWSDHCWTARRNATVDRVCWGHYWTMRGNALVGGAWAGWQDVMQCHCQVWVCNWTA
ncbi:unnamed protein product, partial [Linum tenue]